MTHETTEATVRETLGKSYDQYGFQGNQRLIRDFVAILNDPSESEITTDGEASSAAQNIRASLWVSFTGGGEVYYALASIATIELFTALGRENELGWIKP